MIAVPEVGDASGRAGNERNALRSGITHSLLLRIDDIHHIYIYSCLADFTVTLIQKTILRLQPVRAPFAGRGTCGSIVHQKVVLPRFCGTTLTQVIGMIARTVASSRHSDRTSFDSRDQCGAVTEGFRGTIERLLNLMPGRSTAKRRKRALAVMAGLVGGLILSRAVDDADLSDEILEAATTAFGHLSERTN